MCVWGGGKMGLGSEVAYHLRPLGKVLAMVEGPNSGRYICTNSVMLGAVMNG